MSPGAFDDVLAKFDIFRDRQCPPGSAASHRAHEAASLLRELAFLDGSIIANFQSASQDAYLKAVSVMRKAAENDPKLAQALANVDLSQPRQFVASSDNLLRLQADTSTFYYRAHRLLGVLEALPELEGVECNEIRIVRNQLLEHAGQGKSNREDWSFGFADEVGPQLRPLFRGSQPPSHSDPGYIPNRDALIAALTDALSAV